MEAFLATYYGAAPNGLRLAGTTLAVPKEQAAGRRSITLLIAGLYQVAVSPGITFTIDGAAVSGDRVVLEAGRHDLAWQGAGGTISLLITPCAERRRQLVSRPFAPPFTAPALYTSCAGEEEHL